MMYWLMQQSELWRGLSETSPESAAGTGLLVRSMAAALTALLLTLLLGGPAIRWLRRHCPERIASDSARLNELHAGKRGTPTMGGLFVMAAVLFSSLLWCDLSSRYVWLSWLLGAGLTLTGGIDDWVKLRTSRKGLTMRQKLAAQLLSAGIVAVLLYLEHRHRPLGHAVVLPCGGPVLQLGPWYVPWAALVMVAGSNALNLTDGLDGLAAGCGVPAVTAYAALSLLAGQAQVAAALQLPAVSGSGELGVLLSGAAGGLLGFLWFNTFPARVFMGDTGSLPLGGLLAFAAVVCQQEVRLLLIGGVLVLETISVILQVACFKMTGRRVLRCSPLHNHFLFGGHHETRIVAGFWLAAALLALAGMATLKFH